MAPEHIISTGVFWFMIIAMGVAGVRLAMWAFYVLLGKFCLLLRL